MMSENRQREYNPQIVADLRPLYEQHIIQAHVSEGLVLEGTGSLVFDHSNSVVYLNESKRATLRAFDMYMEEFDLFQKSYRAVPFIAEDRHKQNIYHTNVMLADLDRHLICCLDSITRKSDRELIIQTCRETGKELVEIGFTEMENFCGNIIQLGNDRGESVVLMSERARQSFRDSKWMDSYSHVVTADLSTIETVGGGSARCMVAELF